MEIRRCKREEYEMFLTMVNTAFFPDKKEWFEQNMGNCTPYADLATDEEIAKHIICRCDGQIVGAVGVYPMDWIVSNIRGEHAVLKAYGIGQVSCLPAYRGQGVMTALLKTAEKDMRAQGAVVGFLGGDRWRYGHFGYDFGGNTVRYTIARHRFAKLAALPEKADVSANACGALTLRKATYADCDALNRAYAELPSYMARDARAWERHFLRKKIDHAADFCWYIGESADKKGYLLFLPPNRIPEIYGDADVAAQMLQALFAQSDCQEFIVHYPMQNGCPSPMGHMLFQGASWAVNEPVDLFSIIDAQGMADSLLPILPPHLHGRDIAALPPERLRLLMQRLIGYAYRPLPDALTGFEAVMPLCAWVPPIDNI